MKTMPMQKRLNQLLCLCVALFLVGCGLSPEDVKPLGNSKSAFEYYNPGDSWNSPPSGYNPMIEQNMQINPTAPCALGQTLCNGSCLDLATDHNNCGTCGNVCKGGRACLGGTCVQGQPICEQGGENITGNGFHGYAVLNEVFASVDISFVRTVKVISLGVHMILSKGHKIALALYTDNGGKPGRKLAETGFHHVVKGKNIFPLLRSKEINAGTYHIAFILKGGTGSAGIASKGPNAYVSAFRTTSFPSTVTYNKTSRSPHDRFGLWAVGF